MYYTPQANLGARRMGIRPPHPQSQVHVDPEQSTVQHSTNPERRATLTAHYSRLYVLHQVTSNESGLELAYVMMDGCNRKA